MRLSAATHKTGPNRSDKVIELFSGLATADIQDLWNNVEPVALRVNTGEGRQEYEKSLELFTVEQRYAHAILAYVQEVSEGGHHQFYFNSSGILWEDAMNGLRAIGESECAAVLSASALRAGGFPPARCQQRRNILKRLSPRFHDLDARFHRTDPLPALREYMKANRAAFYFTRAPI